MAWTEPDLNDFLPGEPYTSAKALLQVQNPVSIAAGDEDAPKVQGVALANVALPWIERDGTTEDTITGTFSRLDLMIVEYEAQDIGAASSSIVLQFALSDDDGSTWGSWQAMTTFSADGTGYAWISISDAEVIYYNPSNDIGSNRLTTAAITVPAGEVDAIKFRASAAGWAHIIKPYVYGGAA